MHIDVWESEMAKSIFESLVYHIDRNSILFTLKNDDDNQSEIR